MLTIVIIWMKLRSVMDQILPGNTYDEFKIISKGMGSIVLRMDERMSERNRNNIKEYGLKFQKRKARISITIFTL